MLLYAAFKGPFHQLPRPVNPGYRSFYSQNSTSCAHVYPVLSNLRDAADAVTAVIS
jgi:hypothetical protein